MSATYEGREIQASAEVVAIAKRAATNVAAKKQESLGVVLESAFPHPPATESPLANLMTHAMRDATGADISIEAVVGGIRNTLPAGELTFGDVYEMFPFDNRTVILELTGSQLRDIVAAQSHRGRRRAGFSGMHVFIECENDTMDVAIQRPDGSTIQMHDTLTVVVNDYLALGGDGVLAPVIPPGGFEIDYSRPLTRDVLVEWFRGHGGTLNPDDFVTTAEPKWNLPEELPQSCAL